MSAPNPRTPYRMSGERTPLPPLNGKRILAHLVVNVEHWRFEDPMPRTIITPPHGRESVPDVPNFSWAEYGMRAGLPRILDLFRERRLAASVSLNAGVIDAYPQAATAMLEAGWEFIGHGIHQRALSDQADDEAALVDRAATTIESFTGRPLRGWLSPGLRETVRTPDILAARGIDHVFDWVLDDLPSPMRTESGDLLSVPYNLEVNDSIVYAIERHATGQMLERLRRTLALFETECSANPRVLAIGLHPHLIAVPHRFHELIGMIDALAASPEVLFTTGSAIADWYRSATAGDKW